MNGRQCRIANNDMNTGFGNLIFAGGEPSLANQCRRLNFFKRNDVGSSNLNTDRRREADGFRQPRFRRPAVKMSIAFNIRMKDERFDRARPRIARLFSCSIVDG